MYSRRTILKAAVTAGAVTVFSGTLGGLSAFAKSTLRVRRSLHNMSLDDPDLATYRDFVGIMQGKDQSQVVSWLGFANQHGSLDDGFKYCPHGDWYFLPWHRGFVLMYENAARQFTGNNNFAMPYWNWTADRLMPQAFTDKTYKGKPNPLYVPNRNTLTGPNALTDAIVGPDVMKKIYAETNYEIFGTSRSVDNSVTPPLVQNDLDPKWVPMGGGNQGTMERTPHNLVHNNIGAFMPTAASPRDPIFMMHHGNIDRIWANWSALGRKNSTDPLWLNMPFTNNYIKPDGSFYTQVVKDMQSTDAFGYRYDDRPSTPDNKVVDPMRSQHLLSLFSTAAGANVAESMQRIQAVNTASATTLKPLSTSLQLKSSTLKNVTGKLQSAARAQEVFALIKNIKIGNDVASIRVFVNRDNVAFDVPDTDPHYVTTLGFLTHAASDAHQAHKSLPSAIVDLTDTLKKLAGLGRVSSDTVSVQLLPVPKPGVTLEKAGAVVPASIEIAVI